MEKLEQRIRQYPIVPVIALSSAEQAEPLAKVLVENGLPVAEITFRTDAAEESIRRMRAAYPDMLIAAGTVLKPEQADAAIDAGVDFIVSPGFNPAVVRYCQQRRVLMLPGVNNPGQAEQAMEMGLEVLKFFPAEASGGVAMLKSMAAVYPVRFMPTGGISPANVRDYLALDSVIACGGTWMVPQKHIDNAEWDVLAGLIRECVKLFDQ